MKSLIYQVNIGKPSKLYDFCTESVAAYCDKYSIKHIVQKEPILNIKPDPANTGRSRECCARKVPLPIFEKENAFNYLEEYNQVAIIDADIYIRPTAPYLFDELPKEYAFGAVVERDMPITPKYAKKITKYSAMQYQGLKSVTWKWNSRGAEFMNMGLMVMNKIFLDFLDGDNPKEFISRPEFKNFVDGVGSWKWATDQTLLNFWIRQRQVPTKHLDWKWNGLYKGITKEAIKECYFIHFFLRDHLPNRGENIKELLKQI